MVCTHETELQLGKMDQWLLDLIQPPQDLLEIISQRTQNR